MSETEREANDEVHNLLDSEKHAGLEEETNLDPLQHEQEQYDAILQATLRKTRIATVVGITAPFLISSRHFILQLYMLALSPQSSIQTISTIVFAGSVWYAIFTFTVTWLGDKYGHDRMIMFGFICNGIGVLLESVANNLVVFTIGFFINRVNVMACTTAYIFYMLPHKHAVPQRTRLVALYAIVFLMGPVIAGSIGDYISYRTIFWLNTVILVVCILLNIAFINGSQKQLQQQQLSLSEAFLRQQDKDDIFPICKIANTHTAEQTASWSAFFQDIGQHELKILSISIVTNSFCWCIENVVTYYLAVVLMRRYEDLRISVLYAAAMRLCMAIPFAMSNVMVPKFAPRILPNHVYIITTSAVIHMLSMFTAIIISRSNADIVWLWLLFPAMGASFGAMEISTAMSVLEMQPKQHSGKVNAVQLGLNLLFGGFGVIFIGYLWLPPYFGSYWFVQGLCSLAVFGITFVVWCMVKRTQ